MKTCGDCTLCCTLTKVPELEKNEGIKCRYCDAGCSIYENRPGACRDYQCVWLKEQLDDSLRPDRCHVMFEHLEGTKTYVGMIEKGYSSWSQVAEDYANFKIDQGYSVIMNVGVGKQRYIKTAPNTTETEVMEELLSAYKRLINGGC